MGRVAGRYFAAHTRESAKRPGSLIALLAVVAHTLDYRNPASASVVPRRANKLRGKPKAWFAEGSSGYL